MTLINDILQNLNGLGDKKLMIKWKHIVDNIIEDCLKQHSFRMNHDVHFIGR
jgi:hypothetical protein